MLPIHPVVQRSSASNGVTLIETILVIMVLSLATVGGSFVLRGDWLQRRTTTDATSEIVQTLHAARNTAVMNQTNVNVRHLRVSGRERLQVVEAAGPVRAGNTWEVDLGSDVTIGGSPNQIQFQPTGTCDRSLQWNLGAANTGVVVVNGIDGRISSR